MKTIFVLAVFFVGWPCLTASGQRLVIESRAAQGGPVTVSGAVVEVRKYSFVLDTIDGEQTVRLGRGAELQLKLHKPIFKPQGKSLLVQLPNTEKPWSRKTLQLPEPLYVKVVFAHENQMKRVMSTKTKRFNNYQLSETPFKSASGASAVIGQLVVVEGQERYRLKTPDSTEHDIILGHQNALMSGFGIQDLTPTTTQAEVVGVNSGGDIIASQAYFWPIEKN